MKVAELFRNRNPFWLAMSAAIFVLSFFVPWWAIPVALGLAWFYWQTSSDD